MLVQNEHACRDSDQQVVPCGTRRTMFGRTKGIRPRFVYLSDRFVLLRA